MYGIIISKFKKSYAKIIYDDVLQYYMNIIEYFFWENSERLLVKNTIFYYLSLSDLFVNFILLLG